MKKFLSSKWFRYGFLVVGGLLSISGSVDLGLGCFFAYMLNLELNDV